MHPRYHVEISVRAKILRAEESLGPLVLGGMIMDLSHGGAGLLLFNMSDRDYRHIVRYRASKIIKLQFQLNPDPNPFNLSGAIIYLDYLNKGAYTACSAGVQFDELDIPTRARYDGYLETLKIQKQRSII